MKHKITKLDILRHPLPVGGLLLIMQEKLNEIIDTINGVDCEDCCSYDIDELMQRIANLEDKEIDKKNSPTPWYLSGLDDYVDKKYVERMKGEEGGNLAYWQYIYKAKGYPDSWIEKRMRGRKKHD